MELMFPIQLHVHWENYVRMMQTMYQIGFRSLLRLIGKINTQVCLVNGLEKSG